MISRAPKVVDLRSARAKVFSAYREGFRALRRAEGTPIGAAALLAQLELLPLQIGDDVAVRRAVAEYRIGNAGVLVGIVNEREAEYLRFKRSFTLF